jgi:hypothetical protein
MMGGPTCLFLIHLLRVDVLVATEGGKLLISR